MGQAFLWTANFDDPIGGVENTSLGYFSTSPPLEPPVTDNPFVRPLQPLGCRSNAIEQSIDPVVAWLLRHRGSVFSGIEVGSKQGQGERKHQQTVTCCLESLVRPQR